MPAGPLRRRERFILGCAMALGVSVTLVHEWPLNDLWPAYEDPTCIGAVFRESVLMILSTGFVLAAVVSVILNLVIPYEEVPEADQKLEGNKPGLESSSEEGSVVIIKTAPAAVQMV